MHVYCQLLVAVLLVGCGTVDKVTDKPTQTNNGGISSGSETPEAQAGEREHIYTHAIPDVESTHDIVSFYLDVEQQSQFPPDEKILRKICEKKLDGGRYITFITIDEKKTLLYALTDKRMGIASESVYLYTRYFKDPVAILRVSAWKTGVTPDWGYVFDRNQDGKVDYLAFLGGPSPVAPIGYQEDLPKVPGTMKGDQFLFFIENQPLVFWHVADDNYDGRADGLAMRADEVSSGWSFGWMVVQSTEFNNNFDSCMYYSEHDIEETHVCKRTFIGGKYVVPEKYTAQSISIEMANGWLSTVNKAARECGFNASSFYDAPRPFSKTKPK